MGMAVLRITRSCYLHSARHPQVDHPNHAGLQLAQEELSFAIEAINDLAGEPGHNVSRIHIAPPGPDMAQLDFNQLSLFHHWCQLTPNCLDFWKLGHLSTVMATPGLTGKACHAGRRELAAS
jgi:hypothetical protein